MFIQSMFSVLASAVSLYSFVCIARIMLTWIPSANDSSIGVVLSTLCDPYLNLFRRFKFRSMPVDFTPILALGGLSVLSTIFANIAAMGTISVGVILALLVNVICSFFNFIFLLLAVLLAVRIIANVAHRDTFSAFWHAVDTMLNPLVSKVSSLCKVNGGMTYKTELIISLLSSVCGWFALRVIQGLLIPLLIRMPF